MPPNPKYRKLENETVGVIDSSVSDEEDSVIEEMGNALEKATMKDMSMSALRLKLQRAAYASSTCHDKFLGRSKRWPLCPRSR